MTTKNKAQQRSSQRQLLNRFLEPYAVFTDDGEYGQEVGEAEELSDPLANVEELHLASCGARRGVEADQGAEAHAVHAGDVGEIEHDPFAAWDDGSNLGVEDVGQLGDQLSMAMDDDHFVSTFKFKGERGQSWLIWHRAFSIRNTSGIGGERSERVSHTAAGFEAKILRLGVRLVSDGDRRMIQLSGNHCSN